MRRQGLEPRTRGLRVRCSVRLFSLSCCQIMLARAGSCYSFRRLHPRRAADTGCCRGVPGRPSKHGATIDAHRSRPICPRHLERGHERLRASSVKGTVPRRRDMLFTMRIWWQMSSRLVISAGSTRFERPRSPWAGGDTTMTGIAELAAARIRRRRADWSTSTRGQCGHHRPVAKSQLKGLDGVMASCAHVRSRGWGWP